MLIKQSVSGVGDISTSQVSRLEAIFQENLEKGAYPPLSIAYEEMDSLKKEQAIAHRFKETFESIIILGTGGSSLGGQTVYALRYVGLGLPQPKPRLYFMDNIDPATFDDLLRAIDPKTTGVLAISKSGSTAETVCQLLTLLEYWKSKGLEQSLRDHFVLLTEPKDSPLRRLGNAHQLEILDHPSQIGGRFSVFSAVGALPALIAGVDFQAIRAGAREIFQNPRLAIEGACFLHEAYQAKSISMAVLMPYLDRLNSFALWFRQLWAESLGKEGKGITPIKAMGTVDQHSQTQLYLDGPSDKFFTFILSKDFKQFEELRTQDSELSYLNNRRMSDLLVAEQQATLETLREKGHPVRSLQIESLTEKTLGALMAHFMVETICMAHLLSINAFDQPAVERGKVLTREYLTSLHYG